MRYLATRWRSAIPPCSALLAKRSPALAWQASRLYSAAAASPPLPVDVSKLTIQKTEKPSELKKPEELVFGRTFTGMQLPTLLFI